MFRWYQGASRCYVYLPDVSIHGDGSVNTDDNSTPQSVWEPAFRSSRWFTRGWTLQELIAPSSVEFFSTEGMLLGDKESLKQQIHEITGLPVRALEGHVSEFSLDEKMAWAENRQTKIKEDKAYSLLGIFNTHMPLIYGEGVENAFRRLFNEVRNSSNGRLLTVLIDRP